jgi:hypothetical protein
MSVTMSGCGHQIGDGTNSRYLQEQGSITDRRRDQTCRKAVDPVSYISHWSHNND